MSSYTVIPLLSKPGIQRDGTPFASEHYIDGQWCRFYMGRPRKIGGYKLLDPGSQHVTRSLFPVAQPNTINLYMGRWNGLTYNTFNFNGESLTGEVDVTPEGYEASSYNVWDFDLFTTTTSQQSQAFVVASAIPNGQDVSNTTNGQVYYGTPGDPASLKSIDPGSHSTNQEDKFASNQAVSVSGGVVFASPFMLVYGNNGFIRWSAAGCVSADDGGSTTNAWPDENYLTIANSKIVQMYPTRGSSVPQLLAWTLNSLINVSYTVVTESASKVTTGTFTYAVIEDNITVMSPQSIVQYNQQFFWVGIDQFYFFNGIVQRLDNSMSTDWFFQNINLSQRAKVWGMAIPRYKEIWWFYPRGEGAIECNAVVIYNTELNVWYDSVISRASGVSPGIFPYPLMSDAHLLAVPSGRGMSRGYGLWMHEYGVDEVIGSSALAIPSWFETHITTLFDQDPQNNRLMRSRRIEPDFAQPVPTEQAPQHMTVTVNNRMFASDQPTPSGPYVFDPHTSKIDDVNSQGRLVSFVFESNEAGGTYQAGKTLLNYNVGDVRP